MLEIRINGESIQITGNFDFGYMGCYPAETVHLYNAPSGLRRWKTVRERLGTGPSTDAALSACLTEYFNAFEQTLQKNRKQVNDNFLIRMFEDMEGCGNPFWEIEGLTRREFLPPDPREKTICGPHWDEMRGAEMAFWETPNDGSLEKPDVEALLRKNFPALDLDALLTSIRTEYLSLEDGGVAFQCSDGFGEMLLCGAYDRLDERLVFRDWHNF